MRTNGVYLQKAMWGVANSWQASGEKVKRLRSSSWQLQNSHRDVKCSRETIVNNTVTTMYGAGGSLNYQGEPFVKHVMV